MSEDKLTSKTVVTREPPLKVGTIVARWVSPSLIEIRDRSADESIDPTLLSTEEALALRDWITRSNV